MRMSWDDGNTEDLVCEDSAMLPCKVMVTTEEKRLLTGQSWFHKVLEHGKTDLLTAHTSALMVLVQILSY